MAPRRSTTSPDVSLTIYLATACDLIRMMVGPDIGELMSTGAHMPTPPESSNADDTARFAFRLGSISLLVPGEGHEPLSDSDVKNLLDSVQSALRKDNRVASLIEAKHHPDFCHQYMLHPGPLDATPDGALRGSDARGCVQFSAGIQMDIRVPLKNQPTWHDDIEATTTDYVAMWDGMTLAVGFDANAGVRPAGGQVVFDVLRDAARAVGAEVYVQACKPMCEHLFLHADVVSLETEDETRVGSLSTGAERNVVELAVAPGTSIQSALSNFFYRVRGGMAQWTLAKNTGWRVLTIEDYARADLVHLFSHFQEELEARLDGWSRKRLVTMRPSWRRISRLLTTRLWMHMANTEQLMRQRRYHMSVLESSAADQGTSDVVLRDIEDESDFVETLNLDFLRQATEHAAASLDSRSVVHATALGIIGGGLAGALVTVLLS